MKQCIFISMLLLPALLFAQPAIKRELNLPRPGDVIIKQQVKYKDPGRAGENVIWNFGNLESINSEYSLKYSAPYPVADSMYIMGRDTLLLENLLENDYLFIGTERRTRYYYRYSDTCLWTLGYENAATFLHYDDPLLIGVFPLKYGDRYSCDYTTSAIYSMTVPYHETGNAGFEADAYGMLVLPSGDTLQNVIRTKNVQFHSEQTFTQDGDSISLNTSLETFKWYSNGYRYPVFETLRTIIYKNSTEADRYETAFFYPPQEHYYLEDDTENLNVLDSLANITADLDPWAGLNYNIFPNPVTTFLELELYLPKTADIRIQLRSSMGLIVLDERKGSYPAGFCSFQLNVSTIPIGNYIFDVWLNEKLIGEIIMKR
ncbi:MAG: hypothetical protein LBJ72_15400 [Dysgonamonadaceae bacterium]|jgi:hypothetical protein|nr:hypothetical protein [Dysgonamonadaceae bacterium]